MAGRKFHIDLDGQPNQSIGYLAGMARDTRQVTLSVLGKLSAEEIDWQYRPGWNTIGALLDHIAAIEHVFRIEFIEDRKMTEAENLAWETAIDMGVHLPKLIGIKTIEQYRHTLMTSGDMFLKALETVSPEQFNKRRPEYDEKEGCNLAWVLYHKVEDEIYHRGQISIIRKLYKESIASIEAK